MTDLRDLVDPLLSDPPHPAPPLAELRTRVDRRRRRRARTIGAASIATVALVAVAVLALPRDTELRVGGGETPATQPPPPLDPTAVQLVVTPESAPATTERTIEIRNTSSDDYSTCGTYDLFRWDGQTWSPIIRVFLGGGGTMFGASEPSSTDECSWSPISVAAGETTNLGFDPDTSVLWAVTATALPGTAPLAEGWYELREPPGASTGVDPGGRGRFEITAPGDGATTSTTAAPRTDDAPATIELYPGPALLPLDEKLPDRLVAVDDDSVAIAWDGPCNEPADRVVITETSTEVEIRLSPGRFVTTDCLGEPDRWVASFDLPTAIGARRLVARAQGAAEEIDDRVRVAARPTTPPDAGDLLPSASPIAFQIPAEHRAGVALITIPYPLVAPDHACVVSTTEIDGTYVPMVRMGVASAGRGVESCNDVAVMIAPGDRLFGAR